MTVRSCPQCGASVQDGDEFCGNCGTYLGWSAGGVDRVAGDDRAVGDNQAAEADRAAGSDRVAGTDRAAEADRAPADDRAAEGLAAVQDLVAGRTPPVEDLLAGGVESLSDGARAGSAAGVGPAVGESAATRPGLWARWRAWVRSRFGKDPGTTADQGTGAASVPTDSADAARVRTGAGSAAVVAAGPSDVVLGPVLPGRPEARRPLPSTGPGVAVDGPPCPVCGTTNPPGRRFCRRCATPLLPAGPAARAARRRGRPRRRGDTSRWLRRLAALLVVAALVVAGVLFAPRAVGLFEDLRDRLAKPAPIAPARTSATVEVPDHPAAAAVDGLSNRYWGAPAVGDAVEFTFDRPFRLLSVVVHTGASAQPEQFREQARPTALDVVVTSAGGATRTIAVALNDQPGPQRTDTGISEVVAVRLVVTSAAGLGAGRHVALGEVEFFRRP
ncbi:zinc-ribbon domain-containing protein [Saccharothrix sp. BKS2]|uniref:zinc-ribbon domain-containing protein n=1 Tax=Saccharothrix sp. BKS2 TaxID=3064400 RepID=UPI0039EC6DFA